jgi:hypothetical protein
MPSRVRTLATPRHLSRTARPRPVRRWVWTVLVLLVFVAAAVVGLPRVTSHRGPPPSDRRAAESVAPAVGDGRWSDVLARIDARRDRAWRQGRPGRLATVFVPGSVALRADRAALRGYLRRGYDVGPTRLAYWRVRLVADRSDRVRLAMVDRLLSVQVTGPDGRRHALPVDRPTRHVVTLVRTRPSGWRIATIHGR